MHDAVGRDLVAGAQHEQVVEHDSLDGDLARFAVAHDTRLAARSSTASRSRVRFARYSCTMPMSALATSTMPNSASWHRPDDEDHDEQRPEDRVEPGEDVGPDDLGERAARPLVGASLT